MPRRPLPPPPSPSPQTPPQPSAGGGLSALPAHLFRPKAVTIDSFPQHQAFMQGLPKGHPGALDIMSSVGAAQKDPALMQTLRDREAQSNFSAYAPETYATPAIPEEPSLGMGDYTPDIVDATNSAIGRTAHEAVKAGVHGLGYLAGQGEGLVNAVTGGESGIAGELTRAYDDWNAGTQAVDGSTYDPKTLPGMIAQPLVQGGTGFLLGGPILQGTRLASAPWLAQGMARGGIADLLAFDPMAPRGSDAYNDFVSENGGAPNVLTEALAQQPGDSELMGRTKNLAEGGILGAGLEGLMRGAAGGASRLMPRRAQPQPLEPQAPLVDPLPSRQLTAENAVTEANTSPFGYDRVSVRGTPDDPAFRVPEAPPADAPPAISQLRFPSAQPDIAAAGRAPIGAPGTYEPGTGAGLGSMKALREAATGKNRAPSDLPEVDPDQFVPTGARSVLDADGLPAGKPGEFVQTGSRPALDADGLPAGKPGEFVPSGGPRIAEDGLPDIVPGDFSPVMPEGVAPRADFNDVGIQRFSGEGRAPRVEENLDAPTDLGEAYRRPQMNRAEGYNKFDADPQRAEGYREFNAAPREEEGYFTVKPSRRDLERPSAARTAPRQDLRGDVQPEARDPTVTGEDPVIVDPLSEYKAAGVDPNSETMAGWNAADPVEVPDAYTLPRPRPAGERVRMARDDSNPNDPYADTFRQSKLSPDDQPAATPTYEKDPSLPETEVQLDPVVGRAQEGRAQEETRIDHPPAQDPSSTALPDPPGTAAKPKPGLAHLSPKAQEWVAGLKPGERSLLTTSIAHFRENPDLGGDLGNLKMVLDFKTGASKGSARGETPSPKAEPLARSESAEGKTQTTDEVPAMGTPGQMQSAGGDLRPLWDGVAGLAQVVGGGAKYGVDKWTKRLLQVVADMPGGALAADKAKNAVDHTRALQGKFDAVRQRFLGEMRGRTPKAKAARASFAEVEWDGDAGFARINDVLDGDAKPRPEEVAAVKAYRQAFLDTGKEAENLAMPDGSVGMKINVGGKMVPFTADPTRQRAARVGTNDLHWYAAHPADPESMRLAKIISDYNPGMKEADVLEGMDFWSERGVTKRGMAEEARAIEHFPTHYRTAKGEIVQLLENDPQKIIDAVTRRFPQRMAFNKFFGQEAVPKDLAQLKSLNGDRGEAAGKNLYRALNGMSLDSPSAALGLARPGSRASIALRALNVPWTAWKMVKLSMAPLANLPETLGKGRSITGGNPLRIIKAGLDVSFLNKNSKALVDDLANRGILTREILDWFYNPANRTETLNRYVGNVGGWANQMVNEFNETLVSRAADGWAGLLKKGAGGVIDRFRLKVLDFRPDQIDTIMKGEADKALQDTLVGRAVEWAQASTSQAAERSRAGGSRLWNLVTIADRFGQMNVNRNFDAWAKAGKALADPSIPWPDRLAGVAFAADLTVGQTLAAALTIAGKAIVTGGGAVLLDKALGSPVGLQDFLLDAFVYGHFTAPVAIVTAGATEGDKHVAEILAQPFLPISTLQNMRDAFSDSGRYEGMSFLERGALFLRSGAPITPTIGNIAAVMGLAEDDKELDAAISSYYTWRRKYAPFATSKGGDSDPGAAIFRGAMREAANAMRDGADPSPAVAKALRLGEGKAVRASLLGKRLLKGLKPEQEGKMGEYLGNQTMGKLRQYDALLEAWAAVAYRPRR